MPDELPPALDSSAKSRSFQRLRRKPVAWQVGDPYTSDGIGRIKELLSFKLSPREVCEMYSLYTGTNIQTSDFFPEEPTP